MRAIRELTQEEDWKTQDGRMTKNVARECAFLILRDIFPSFAVLSVPAVLLRKFPIIRTRKRQTATPANKFNSKKVFFSTSIVRSLIVSITKWSNMIGC